MTANLLDTPRLYTALAEWTACLVYILILRQKTDRKKLIPGLAGMLALQCLLQVAAGKFPLYLWMGGMAAAAALMYLIIYMFCGISPADAIFMSVRAFVLAEFTASLGWQLYSWQAMKTGRQNDWISFLTMFFVYLCVFFIYYMLEKKHLPAEERPNVNVREILGSVSIALSAFLISNLSFVIHDSPFSSASSSILYIRTLVDFGGLVMLFAQQDKREELRLRSENESMNTVLQRQYEQYRLAKENAEFLKREFHDLKHYLLAIRREQDPYKRDHYLSEMEEAIHMQESLADTGNSVLDAVLTTKSVYCAQHKITFNCMTDGRLLNFMDVKDICSIFGNALDNAIECSEKYDDPQKRLITLSMYRQGQLLMIRFENYCEENLTMADTLPRTTKENKSLHGYGLKSIRRAAENYGGTMTVHENNHWFILQVLIPILES